MAQASWKCLTLGKQQYFLFGMLLLKSKNYQLCKKTGEAIAPFGYSYAQQSFKFLQRTSFARRKLLLCFILREKTRNR